MALLTQEGYEVKTVAVTKELYQEFVELYKETTEKKERLLPINLHEQIYSKVLGNIPCYFCCITKNGTIHSALAFSVQAKKVSKCCTSCANAAL